MAIVGDAYIVVRAITTGFEKEVRDAAKNINLDRDGRRIGQTFSNGFSDGMGKNLIRSLLDIFIPDLIMGKFIILAIRMKFTLMM